MSVLCHQPSQVGTDKTNEGKEGVVEAQVVATAV